MITRPPIFSTPKAEILELPQENVRKPQLAVARGRHPELKPGSCVSALEFPVRFSRFAASGGGASRETLGGQCVGIHGPAGRIGRAHAD